MQEKDWFEDWFNSPYYHLLYANRSEAEAELFIKKLVEQLQLKKAAKVLDVACGKGRHSKTFAKLGMEVTGIDLSENSIAEAKQHACENLHFDVWDMRRTYKKNEFDVVVNLFSSFGYFKEDKDDYACIHSFLESLKIGGILVMDYINTEWAVKNMKSREIIQRGEIQFHISKKLKGGFIKKRIEFIDKGEHYEFEEQLKVINAQKFKIMLELSGFKLKFVFGDYALTPFIAATSPRLILIAYKP